MDYDELKPYLKERWRAKHNLLGFVYWRPFQNERHFNRVTSSLLEELDNRSDEVQYDQVESRQEDPESEVIAEIIDVVVRREFPNVNVNSVIVRMAIHFVAVEIVKK